MITINQSSHCDMYLYLYTYIEEIQHDEMGS